jgi:hypothetical protein
VLRQKRYSLLWIEIKRYVAHAAGGEYRSPVLLLMESIRRSILWMTVDEFRADAWMVIFPHPRRDKAAP